MTMIRVLNPKKLWPSSVIAVECGLWYCVNNYDSKVKDGKLSEIVSSAPSTRSQNSWQWSSDRRAILNNSNLVQQRENSTGPDTLSYGMFSIDNVTDLQLGDGFNVSQAAAYGISDFLNSTFTRSPDDDDITKAERRINLCENEYNDNNSVLFLQGINFLFENDDDHIFHTSTAMSYLYYSQDLNATFATLAKSMTNSIRENSDDNLIMSDKVGILHVVYQIQ